MNQRNYVLAVDDDPIVLDIIEETLSDLYDVALATSGLQALNLLDRERAPDIILLDVDMPEMDGYNTLKHIREVGRYVKTPILFVTGFDDSENEVYALELGAQDYISKPFNKKNLLTRIRIRLTTSMQMGRFEEICSEFMIDEEHFMNLAKELTRVERGILRLIIYGYDNWEIAEHLHYSYGYVKNSVSRILDKLNVCNRRTLRSLFKIQGVSEK